MKIRLHKSLFIYITKRHAIYLALLTAILSGIIIISAVSCSGDKKDDYESSETPYPEESSSEITEVDNTEHESTEEETVISEYENYFTGLPVEESYKTGKRPVSFMINNARVATPHIGVGKADMVFEMEVEGGMTRMMAFFADVRTVPEIGSIRSTRHNFLDLSGAFDAITVHVGASVLGRAQIASQNSPTIDAGIWSNYFWRDNDWIQQRGYEHSVKTNGEKLIQVMERGGFRPDVSPNYSKPFKFKDTYRIEPAGDINAYNVDIPITAATRAIMSYSEEKNGYYKSQYGEIQVDFADGSPYLFTNVLILKTTVKTASGSNQLREIDLVSGGEGYYISGGKATEINWTKGGTNERFSFTHTDGREIEFNRGRFYIAVINKSGNVAFSGIN